MSEWITNRLGNLIEVNKNSINKNFKYEEIEYLETASVIENRFKDFQRLNLKEAPSRAKRIVKENDIVYSTVRPILRHYGIVKNVKPNSIVSTGFAVLTAKKIDPDFLFYYLTTDEIVYFLNSVAESNTTTYPAFNASLFENIEITIPKDIKTQKEIAQILSSLDDKIELNLQMNQTLEAMAQAIFKEWFVPSTSSGQRTFNFPGFDGELVDGLPKGWRVGKVKDVCRVNSNTLSTKDILEEIHYIEISEVDKGIINNIKKYPRGEEPSRAKRKLTHGDTVLSTVRPNRGAYFISLFPGDNLIASTGFAVFSPISVPFSFLYFFLTGSEQLEFYGKMADGAAYPAINQSVIMEMDLVIPTNEVLELFHSVAGNSLIKYHNNLEENIILIQIRDTLLPKLMSGKLEVGL
ncbi:MAG: restriction endonuclease subunit S [Bacteroidota bacterium]